MERSPAPVAASASPLPAPPPSATRDLLTEYGLRTPTRFSLGSPHPHDAILANMPSASPGLRPDFNPDDYFASPPARPGAGSASRATPECRRRLFLDEPPTPLRGSASQAVGPPVGGTPTSALLFSFGSLETPRAATQSGATASGRKRARPDSSFSLTNYLSPTRSLLTANNQILQPLLPESSPVQPPPVSVSTPMRETQTTQLASGRDLAALTERFAPSASKPPAIQAQPQAQAQIAVLPTGDNASSAAEATTIPPPPLTAPTSTANVSSAALPATTAASAQIVNTTSAALAHPQMAPSTLVTAVAQSRPAKRKLLENLVISMDASCAQVPFPNSGGGTAAKSRRAGVVTTPITPNDGDTRQYKCSCKASKCLKLYCPCFAASSLCSEGCSCKNCQNISTNVKAIDEARAACLQRDPTAFVPRSRAAAELGAHSKGCNCRKGCSKNYCVCRELGVTCGPRCTCSGPNGCQNGKSDEFPVVRNIQMQRNKKRPALPQTTAPAAIMNTVSMHGGMTTVASMPQATIQSQARARIAQQPTVLQVPQSSQPLPVTSAQMSAQVVAPLAPQPPLLPNTERVGDPEFGEHEQEFFLQLRAVTGNAATPPDEPLFPPTTPERMKKDLLALASTPTTQPTKARRDSITLNNSIQQPMPRPPRILRLKMGCGKPIRPFSIGGTNQ